MMQPDYQPLSTSYKNLFKLGFFGMVIIYMASCFTPLHIHFDSIRYYNIKDCMEYGCPPDSFAATDYLPYGYTALLITLSKLGVLSSFSVILVNCIYLFAALYFVKKIFSKQVSPLVMAVLVLFNWTIIKFSQHPLSEMQYIFFSCASLYCFHRFTKNKSLAALGLSFVFALLTMLTRSVGISLVAGIAAGTLWQYRDGLKRIVQKNKWLLFVGLAIIVGVVFFARQLKLVDYTNLLKDQLSQGLGHFIADNLKNHFTELTEVFLNIPANKVLHFIPGGGGTALFIVLGVVFFAWFLINLLLKKNQFPFYIKAYLLFYSFIIINWPYYDPRFWVPILPLIVVVILRTPFNKTTATKIISRLYLAAYLALGLLAAGYALYSGVNKERFSKNQAGGDYRNEYEVHFFGKPLTDTATHIDKNVVDILNKYD